MIDKKRKIDRRVFELLLPDDFNPCQGVPRAIGFQIWYRIIDIFVTDARSPCFFDDSNNGGLSKARSLPLLD